MNSRITSAGNDFLTTAKRRQTPSITVKNRHAPLGGPGGTVKHRQPCLRMIWFRMGNCSASNATECHVGAWICLVYE